MMFPTFRLIKKSLDAVWETKLFWFFGVLTIILSGSPLFQLSKAYQELQPYHSFTQIFQSVPLTSFFLFLIQITVVLLVGVFFESLLIAAANDKQQGQAFNSNSWFLRLKKTFWRLLLVSFLINAILSVFYLFLFFVLSFLPSQSWVEVLAYLIFVGIAIGFFLIKLFTEFDIFLEDHSLQSSFQKGLQQVKSKKNILLLYCVSGLATTIVILLANILLQNLLSLLFRLLVQSALVYKLSTLFQFLALTNVVLNVSVAAIFYGFILSFWIYFLLLLYKQNS